MSSYVVVGGAALNQTPIDWENNIGNIRAAIAEARARGVHVLCLPELCLTGYGCEDLFLGQWVPRRALDHLADIIPTCRDIAVSVGLPIWFEERAYNCVALIRDGRLLGFYAKRHLADEGVHYEPRWFTPWPRLRVRTLEWRGQTYPIGDQVFDLGEIAGQPVRIGFEICEDAWRGHQRPGLDHAARGANLVLNPSASHFSFDKKMVRRQLVLDGARNFRCAYVYANLLGNEAGKMIYDGDIMIAQHGRMLQQNNRFSFQPFNLASVPVCLTDPAQTPAADLAPDEEDHNEVFAKAVSLALFDYLRKTRSRGFVLSLSGGADSSACLVLVAEMVRRGLQQLGLDAFAARAGVLAAEALAEAQALPEAERAAYLTGLLLRTAYQGTANSSEQTRTSARELAQSVGARFHAWDIDDAVTGYTAKVEAALGRPLTWEQDDIALQNIQSRARSPVIWMLTNATGALLLTTSNRSEGDVGYATMDGDTSGGLAPIAGVDKPFVRAWLRWAEAHRGYAGLRYVNALTPSAELRPLERAQTDEDDLMPYPVLLEIEKLAIRDRHAPREVYELLRDRAVAPPGALLRYVTTFFRLWARNQWKRERLAPSFHVDDFSVDPRSWCRFPILSGGFREELAELAALAQEVAAEAVAE